MKRTATPRFLPLLSLTTLLAVGLLHAPPAEATEIGKSKKIGIGVSAGQPSGVEVMWFFKENHALHGTLGVGFLGGLNLRLNADYNYHIRVFRHKDFDMPLYFGAGVSFWVWFHYEFPYYWAAEGQYITYFGIGLHVPIGVALQFKKTPIDVFFQVAPGVGLFPGIGAYFDGTAGFRYYF